MMVVNNLPIQLTPFVGREEELAEIDRLLADPACRLLTLVGPGGIGKTRLAIQVAANHLDSFPGGVFFIPLQPLSSSEFLVPAIAGAVRYPFTGQESPRDQLLRYLGSQQMLLVLDNFEHLLDGADLLAAILEAAPRVKILVTSREVLDLQEEWIRPLKGLKYPQDDQGLPLEDYSAVRLFYTRAHRVQAGFSLEKDYRCVVQICRLVQGMPLAIELAAAWLKTLPCAEVAAEIQRNLDFLATTLRNVPERHRNVRAVFDQSWQMLSAQEREVFKRLSVFQGGFLRPAAETVTGAGLLTLQSLVDKSLLHFTPGGRYEIHELLRQFAAEKLAVELREQAEASQQHAAYYAGFLQRRAARLKGSEQMQALSEIDAEIDNLRVAWRWVVDQGYEQQVGQSIDSLMLYYQMRSRIPEGMEAFHRASLKFAGSVSRLLGPLWLIEGWFTASTGQSDRAKELLAAAYPLLEQQQFDSSLAFPLIGFVFHHDPLLTLEETREFFQRNLTRYQQEGDQWSQAWTLYSLGILAEEEGDSQQEKQLLLECIQAFRLCGDRWGSTWPLHHLGDRAVHQGAYQEAKSYFEATLVICREIGDQGGIAFALHFLGEIAAALKEFEGSRQYLLDAIRINARLDTYMVYWHLYELGRSFDQAGQKARAVELFAFLNSILESEDTEERIRPALTALEAELPADVFARAKRLGESRDLEATVQSLLAEFTQPPESASRRAGQAAQQTAAGQPGLVEPLSERELEVLRLVAAGLSNREIARQLFITVGAVKKHLNNIFGKLQVGSRIQAVSRARDFHILQE